MCVSRLHPWYIPWGPCHVLVCLHFFNDLCFHLCICFIRCKVGVFSSLPTLCHPIDGSWHPPPFYMYWFNITRLVWLRCSLVLDGFHGVLVFHLLDLFTHVLDQITLLDLWSICDLDTLHMQLVRQVFVNTMSLNFLTNWGVNSNPMLVGGIPKG